LHAAQLRYVPVMSSWVYTSKESRSASPASSGGGNAGPGSLHIYTAATPGLGQPTGRNGNAIKHEASGFSLLTQGLERTFRRFIELSRVAKAVNGRVDQKEVGAGRIDWCDIFETRDWGRPLGKRF
jgi:hypothetical protein